MRTSIIQTHKHKINYLIKPLLQTLKIAIIEARIGHHIGEKCTRKHVWWIL
jgi:hypothetical protein